MNISIIRVQLGRYRDTQSPITTDIGYEFCLKSDFSETVNVSSYLKIYYRFYAFPLIINDTFSKHALELECLLIIVCVL